MEDKNRIPEDRVCKKCGRKLPISCFRKFPRSYVWAVKCNDCALEKKESSIEVGKFYNDWRESHPNHPFQNKVCR